MNSIASKVKIQAEKYGIVHATKLYQKMVECSLREAYQWVQENCNHELYLYGKNKWVL